MNWTEPSAPIEGVSYYNHTIAETPIGRMVIEWKGWKENPSYDIMLGGEWIGVEYDLDSAKQLCISYLNNKISELTLYMNSTLSVTGLRKELIDFCEWISEKYEFFDTSSDIAVVNAYLKSINCLELKSS